MENLVFTQLSIPEVKKLFRQELEDYFTINKSNTNKKEEIIDRAELCKRLSITEPTAIRYERKGKIPSLRIGDSVRYNWPAVIEALESNKKGGRS